MSISRLINKLLGLMGFVVLRRSNYDSLVVRQPSESIPEVNCVLKDVERTLLRSQIATKWSAVDFLYKKALVDKAITRICPLCGYASEDIEFCQLRSHCIFGGGDLLRYVCPSCEVTYGPDKMFSLTTAELSEDYEWHYKVFEEGDSTESELRAFFVLKPDKSGVYLNYGAGGWSSSVQELRAKGWNVYAYEPHNSATSCGQHEWLIRTPEQLQLMSFDGIFSNNVLEHFRHPVQELQEMAKLLSDGGIMAHATPCYEYLYEYTRFHLYFFTGKSKNILMKQANLQLVDELMDGDFMCYVMKPSI